MPWSPPPRSPGATALGLEGTRELKTQLARAQALGGAFIDSQNRTVELGKAHSVAAVCGGIEAIVAALRETAREEVLLGAAQMLSGAGLINVYGVGGISSWIATEFQFRFFRLGLKVVANADGATQRMTAAVADASTIAVGLSISGASKSVADALAITKRYGGKTIAIAPVGSPLAAVADILIPFAYTEDGNYYKPSSSRYKMLALVDMLALLTAETLGPPALEKMRRIKISLDSGDAYDFPLPLGD